MKRLYNLLLVIVLCSNSLFSQEFDLTLTSSESGTKTHVAHNSVTLGPNYSYTPSGGSLTIEIQDPIITGPVSYASSVDPETRTLNTYYMVGATNGSFNVNPLGGASYSIPLELLPGVNGLAPSLSLVYSSNSGPAVAGYGWQIAGLSTISRGPKSFYHDGTARGVELDTSDRFYLDGQRLVTTNSYAYGNTSAEYQTENDIFTRVKQYGTDIYGPGYFKAETKSGLIYEYGNTTASKQKIIGYSQIVNWYVSRISDLFGNQLNFAYFMDRYSIYPYEITYGPNKITFYYKERTDKNSSYFKGTKIEQGLVLDKITVKYNSTIVKAYEFKYNYLGASYNNYSILNEIVEYGVGSSRLNSTAITYQIPEDVAFTQAVNNTTDTYISFSSKLNSGDYNGDGKADIFCLPSGGGWRYYRNNGDNTFTLAQSGDFSVDESSIVNVSSLDINGDDKDDLVFTMGSSPINYYYSLCNGTTFGDCINFENLTGGVFLLLKQDKSTVGDLDGDGLNDLVIINSSGELKTYSFSYSNGQMNPMTLKSTFNFGVAVSVDDKVFLTDFNGDGMADIWKMNSSGIKVYTIRGSSLIELYTNTIPKKDHFLSLGDFNGDGKSDIFIYGLKSGGIEYDWTTWQILQSNGVSFETYYIPQLKTNLKNDIIRRGDFNGDGSSDLMITASADNGWTGHYYYISKILGTGFSSYFYSAGQPSSNKYCLDDYNGDGRDDYLCTDGASPWTNGFMVYNTPGRTNILMEKVGNGLGFLTKLTYTKLSQASTSVYQRGSGAAFPVSDYQGPISVVSSVQFDNGKGTMNSRNYSYEGLKIHLQGKGVLCYSKVKLSDLATGIETENTNGYNTTYFYPQLIRMLTKRAGTTDTIEKVTNTWSQVVLSLAKKRIFPYIQTSVQNNKLTGQSVTLSTAYDNYGNPSPIIKSYSNGPTETTTHTYNNTVSSTQWLLGRSVSSTVQYAGGDTTITRSATRIFNSNNNHLKSETWFAGTSNQIWHRYAYYSYGALQMQIDSIGNNIKRSTQYTYESNFIRVKTITDPLSHVTTNTYDSYGRLYKEQDYLLNQVTYLYDDMNRQTSISSVKGGLFTSTYRWETPTSAPKPARYAIQKAGNDGSYTKRWFDKLGREIRTDVRGFDGTMIYTETKYNTKGQVDSISEPYYSTASALWNRFHYDNYGRKTDLNTPSGRNTTWQYSSNTVTETTAGKSFTKTFASDGTLSSATDAGGSITYSYFPDGKVKNIVAPGNITTSMKYDIAGNQTRLNDPSAGIIHYTYNGFGEILTQQDGRLQTTTLTYYADGRLNQKVTPEGTTSYTYNANKQLTGISSPGSISRSYGYDFKGRVASVTETIPGTSSFSTTFTYDIKGRDSTVTHPSGIVEKYTYNTYGYLSSIAAGGATHWRVTGRNARQQITAGTFGSNLNTTFNYNNYGYPTSTVTGTIQNYQYDFDVVTGNLSWRKNVLQANIQENFEYDNLDRLDRVYRGATTLLDMAYESNKGGITTKTDVGTLNYSSQNKPYALTSINPSTGLITSAMNDSMTYTSFESIKTITEGTYNATFSYNADNNRAKMVVINGSNLILNRWYPNSSFIKDSTSGVSKTYTFIGGDAYTAPVVAIKQNNGTPAYYYLLRDHLGSITHVVNASDNTVTAEYSYDAWGRMRDPSTWACYAPGQEPDLMIAGRGFTGHEHLKWFKFINMNGRMYDPLTGQFLSPDNFVQSPGFTQSFNRFGYCINNPLKYIDPSGLTYFKLNEYWEWESFEYNPFQGGTPDFRQASHGGSNPERVNGTYRYNWNTGKYENNIGDVVTYTEVQNNYVLQKGDVLHSSSLLGSSVTSFYMDPHGSISVSISYNNGSTSWFGVGCGQALGGMFFFSWDAVGNLVTTMGSFQYSPQGGGGSETLPVLITSGFLSGNDHEALVGIEAIIGMTHIAAKELEPLTKVIPGVIKVAGGLVGGTILVNSGMELWNNPEANNSEKISFGIDIVLFVGTFIIPEITVPLAILKYMNEN